MSGLGSSRNVQRSDDGATNCVYSRVQDLVSRPSLRSGYFDETTKTMNEKCFERNEKKMYFWQKPEGVIIHDGKFDNTKSILHPSLTL